jgi:hypothetical protein
MPARRVVGIVADVFHPLIEQPILIDDVLRVQALNLLIVQRERGAIRMFGSIGFNVTGAAANGTPICPDAICRLTYW